MRPVLDVHQLSRRYADRLVLDAVSFQVAAGEIHGLLGPNGAGKTTALECAEGLRKPDSGDITFLGEPVRHGRVPARMGVQLQVGGLPGAMTVEEALRFVSAYKRAPPRPGIVVRLGLAGLEKRPYQQLSVGQQRRLQLALAIAHQPALLILDEPTAGLDVATRAQLHALLAELKSEGTAIILATHDMAEAEKLADQLTVLIAGESDVPDKPRAAWPIHRMGVLTEEADMVRLYQAADLQIVPSYIENLSNAIMEASACALPCIAFRAGGNGDMVLHERSGFLAEPYDPASLADGIVQYLQNPSLRQTHGLAAREHILGFSELDSIAQRHRDLYQRILKPS
jgi:ABC-2 type transport system ATP-binding protein